MSDYSSQTDAYGASSATLTALFDTRAEAERAIARLRDEGVFDHCIRLTEGAQGGSSEASAQREDRGFFEALGDLFFPEEDRSAYAEGLSRGGYLVTVSDLTDAQYDTALDILDSEGSVNIDERAESWRSEGWGGSDVGAAETGVAAGFAEDRASFAHGGEQTLAEGETVPVVEETLRVGKRDTSHGRVRVRSYIRERPVSEEVELTDERVEIERRPVDRPVSHGEDAFRERTIEAEEYGEEAVVFKDARVVEEIGLRRESETRRETISDTERHTEVEIDERVGHDRDRR